MKIYVPKAFEESREKVLKDFLRQNAFGWLMCNGHLSILPFLLENTDSGIALWIHLPKHNPLSEQLADQKEAQFLIQGAHAYISSNAYEKPDVSTYNYQVAILELNVEPTAAADMPLMLEKFSEAFGDDSRKSIPEDEMHLMMQVLKGFRLKAVEFQFVSKLSQNKSPDDRNRIIQQLHKRQQSGALEMAELIRLTLD